MLIDGTDVDDSLEGSVDSDTIYGNAGNDVISGFHNTFPAVSIGGDSIFGGAGNDTIYSDSRQDTIDGGEGNDLISTDFFFAETRRLKSIFNGGEGDDTLKIWWGADFDSLVLDRSASIETVCADKLEGSGYSNLIDLSGVLHYVHLDKSDAPFFLIYAEGGNDTVIGSGQSECIIGGSENDLIFGNDGDDVLFGEDGTDTLYGGAGNDFFAASAGNDVYQGGIGEDSIGVSQSTFYPYSQLVIDATASIETIKFQSSAGSREKIELNFGSDTIDLSGITKAVGEGEFFLRNGSDSFSGTATSDVVFGELGNDIILGNAGNDTLDGGAGSDTLNGGEGDDYLVASGGDIVSGGGGFDTLVLTKSTGLYGLEFGANASFEIIDAAEKIAGTWKSDLFDFSDVQSYLGSSEVFLGSGNDTFIGSVLNDIVDGGLGNDLLIGGDGDDMLSGSTYFEEAERDTLDGGAGNDTLRSAGGSSVLSGGEGYDTLLIDVSFEFSGLILNEAASIERITSTGVFMGTAAANLFDLTGVQSYSQSSASDLGKGNDTFRGSSTGDFVHGGSGNDQLSGNDGDDTLYGDMGDDTIEAGEGINFAHGGDGDDTLIFAGARSDFNLSYVSKDWLGQAIGNGTTTSFEKIEYIKFSDQIVDFGELVGIYHRVTGNVVPDALLGGIQDDYIFGLGGNDTINGFGGNDTIDGGSGADYMSGGLGDDIYLIDSAFDRVSEGVNAGIDTIKTAIRLYTLGANFEKLILLSPESGTLTGNSINNEIVGGSGSDVLNGAGGRDTLEGGDGNDTMIGDISDFYIGGDGLDVVDFSGNKKSTKFSLKASSDGTVEGVIGTRGNDIISGDDHSNHISGGAGKDILTGGGELDYFVFNSVKETGTSKASCDFITDFSDYFDRIDLSAFSNSISSISFKAYDVGGDSRDYTMLYIYLGKDSKVDGYLKVAGLHEFSEADFIFW